MVWVDLPIFVEDKERSLDTLRLLVQSQNCISSQDVYLFWMYFQGSVETAEYMFSQDLIQTRSDISDGDDVFPILAIALRGFGEDFSQWDRFLRLLLRKNSSLHSPVPRIWGYQELNNFLSPYYPCKALEFGTPLDELFLWTETPFEGEAIANRWLQVLSSEGIDVVAYLEEESALHAQQMQLTIPSQCR